MVLLLQAGDGEGALVLLVALAGQRLPICPAPGDGGGGGARAAAGEGDPLPHRLVILVLRPQLDGGRVPHVHLYSSVQGSVQTGVIQTCMTPLVPLVPCVLYGVQV